MEKRTKGKKADRRTNGKTDKMTDLQKDRRTVGKTDKRKKDARTKEWTNKGQRTKWHTDRRTDRQTGKKKEDGNGKKVVQMELHRRTDE
jgi:hypothetical protein